MKIKYKDLWCWITNKTPIRYRGEIYHADYNGLKYFLRPVFGNECIDFIEKKRGVYGLITNEK